jgi:hypothetical protein
LIGQFAFFRGNITGTLIFPDSVQEIARAAVWGNKNLQEVIIGTGMKKIGLINEMSVYDDTLHSGDDDDDGDDDADDDDYQEYGLEAVGPFALCSSLETLTFKQPSTLRKIGDWAFYGISTLRGNLILPDSLEELGKGAI